MTLKIYEKSSIISSNVYLGGAKLLSNCRKWSKLVPKKDYKIFLISFSDLSFGINIRNNDLNRTSINVFMYTLY